MVVGLLSKDSSQAIKEELSCLLYDYFVERHGNVLVGTKETAFKMLLDMLDNNEFIYYVSHNEQILGFITITINNQYDMVKPHLVTNYMYVVPEYRGTTTTLALFATAGHVSMTLGYNMIGSTLIGSSNIGNTRHTKGEEFSRSYLYEIDKFKPTYERYMKKLKFT